MIVSDTFSTKSVRFSPFRIRRSREKLFSLGHGIGNVTSSRQQCRPCFFVTALDGAGVQKYMRHVVLEPDAKDLAALHKGVEESRDGCTGFGDVEQPNHPYLITSLMAVIVHPMISIKRHFDRHALI